MKVHNSCNLACDYCYMYNLADQSWRGLAAAMPEKVVTQVGHRIAEHADLYGLESVRVVLHGGEPLLAGVEQLVDTARTLRRIISTDVDCTVQSNGILLTAARLDELAQSNIRVGVSLDGGREANDRHRRFANGRGSFIKVDRALRMLAARPETFAGILGVIDLDTDPVEMYEAFLEYSPPAVDVLLPHGNWTSPPPGRPPDESTPYGDWLVRLFDRWYDAPTFETRIRLLDEILNLTLGLESYTEAVGLSPVATIVIDIDGTMEQIDTLRSTYTGAVDTGLNVFEHSFDDALTNPGVMARQIGTHALAPKCKVCPVHRICGGGYYPHRYRADTGFRNASVYCADLKRLIEHVLTRVRDDVAGLGRSGS